MAESIDRVDDVRGVEIKTGLAVDRLTAQGPYAVRKITDRFMVDSKGGIRKRPDRTGYLDDGYDRDDTEPVIKVISNRGPRLPSVVSDGVPLESEMLVRSSGLAYLDDGGYYDGLHPIIHRTKKVKTPSEMPSSNGHKESDEPEFFQEILKESHSKPHGLAIERLVPLSVVDQLYGAHFFRAIGHISTGIISIDYSGQLRNIAGKELAIWNDLHRKLQLSTDEDQDTNKELVTRKALIADSINRTTGFRPEEIEEYKRLLATRLRGSKDTDHPVRTVLIG